MVLFELLMSYGMLGLLLIALISSIIPIPTEFMVLGLLDIGKKPELVLIIFIAGSIAGSYIGYIIGKYELRKIIPFHNKEKEKRMQIYFRKYGAFLLLIHPWIPIVGDLAPMVAGIENYESRKFMILISISKTIKCIAIVYFSTKLIDIWTIFIK